MEIIIQGASTCPVPIALGLGIALEIAMVILMVYGLYLIVFGGE